MVQMISMFMLNVLMDQISQDGQGSFATLFTHHQRLLILMEMAETK